MTDAGPGGEGGRELSAEELARLHEAFGRVAYARLLGIEIERLGRGAAVLSLEVRRELTRMEGIVHGGAIASLLDSASGFDVLSLLRPEEQTVTVDLTLHFLRPVTGGRVEARAKVLRAGRRVVTVSIEASDGTGKLVATALTSYLRSS
jgi:uncharacterized protein (TIGR00369 family)